MTDEPGDGGLFEVDLGQRADTHFARPKSPGGQGVSCIRSGSGIVVAAVAG